MSEIKHTSHEEIERQRIAFYTRFFLQGHDGIHETWERRVSDDIYESYDALQEQVASLTEQVERLTKENAVKDQYLETLRGDVSQLREQLRTAFNDRDKRLELVKELVEVVDQLRAFINGAAVDVPALNLKIVELISKARKP